MSIKVEVKLLNAEYNGQGLFLYLRVVLLTF